MVAREHGMVAAGDDLIDIFECVDGSHLRKHLAIFELGLQQIVLNQSWRRLRELLMDRHSHLLLQNVKRNRTFLRRHIQA